MPRPIFVAPHYDDVALSCGGIVAIAARTSEPLIVTVFGGRPDGSASEFARFQHDRWGLDEDEAIAQRRAEDACAARALGTSVGTQWLDFLDAIYRNPAYDSDSALFGQLIPEDAGLAATLAAILKQFDADEYYVPMALGNHVDHQIVLAAGRLLCRANLPVWAYPDVPYAITRTPSAIRKKLQGAPEHLVHLDDDALDRKIIAVGCYRSQTPVLFRDLDDHDTELRRFARRTGAGIPAEAIYRVLR